MLHRPFIRLNPPPSLNDVTSKTNRPLLTEQREVGNRARILRIATYQCAMQWLARPTFKEEIMRMGRYREATKDELGRLDQ